MTAVQQHTIPELLQGKDLLIKSQTGSGILFLVNIENFAVP